MMSATRAFVELKYPIFTWTDNVDFQNWKTVCTHYPEIVQDRWVSRCITYAEEHYVMDMRYWLFQAGRYFSDPIWREENSSVLAVWHLATDEELLKTYRGWLIGELIRYENEQTI